MSAPLTSSITSTDTHRIKAAWVKDGGKHVLMCNGHPVDPDTIRGFDRKGTKGRERGVVYLSAAPSCTVTVTATDSSISAMMSPVTTSLTSTDTHRIKAAWINEGGKYVLLCNGRPVDPDTIQGFDRKGAKGFERGVLYFSVAPLCTVTAPEEHGRYAKICDPGSPNKPYLMYRGQAYQVPKNFDLDVAEKVLSENGNYCLLLPKGLILEHV